MFYGFKQHQFIRNNFTHGVPLQTEQSLVSQTGTLVKKQDEFSSLLTIQHYLY